MKKPLLIFAGIVIFGILFHGACGMIVREIGGVFNSLPDKAEVFQKYVKLREDYYNGFDTLPQDQKLNMERQLAWYEWRLAEYGNDFVQTLEKHRQLGEKR